MILKQANGSQYKTGMSAGFDLKSTVDVIVPAKKFTLFGLFGRGKRNWVAIPTGLFIKEADKFETLEIRPRSGMAYNAGLTVLNSPGTIDADYPGEIKVILINHGTEDFEVKIGDRIAQAVLVTYHRVKNVPVSGTVRTGGFGSTGKGENK